MMQLWYADMVRFMRDASEYGSYNRELSALMAPHLDQMTHICDAGCGLGYLSLALSPYAGRITAVDWNPDAVAVLADNCQRLGIGNITPCCGDIADVVPEVPYDAMVFCFFGGIQEILTTAKHQCDGQVFIITRNYTTHRFSVGNHKTGSYGYATTKELLEQLGIPFEEQTMELEFGQPFRSMEDARRFFETYSKDADKTAITDDFLRKKLVRIDHPDFHLYMPHRRQLALVRFRTEDIPADWV